VIECPYCQSALKENVSECPKCGIDGEKLTRIMGPMPVIFGGVSQDRKLLSPRDIKRLVKVIDEYQRRFPQSRLHFLVRSFPQEMDFKVVLFWVFNQAGLSSQGSKGGKNRDVVFVIDRKRSKAGMIVGYGLEPVLSQAAMDEVVSSGQDALNEGDFSGAFEEMVGTLTDRMREICLGLPELVGLRAKLADEETDDY
jgi:hypothetical protein